MKKIDIEKWDRKTPDLPKDFFDEMQKNVLEKTIHKEEPKVFKLNWVWSSAAAVAVVFGLVFFFKNIQKEESSQMLTHQETEQKSISEISEKSSETIEVEEILPEKKLTPNENTHQGASFASQKIEQKPKLEPKEQHTKENMEKILNAMSKEDFVDLAGTYEQDVYLELY